MYRNLHRAECLDRGEFLDRVSSSEGLDNLLEVDIWLGESIFIGVNI